jgi:hypothetical protein
MGYTEPIPALCDSAEFTLRIGDAERGAEPLEEIRAPGLGGGTFGDQRTGLEPHEVGDTGRPVERNLGTTAGFGAQALHGIFDR